MVALGVIRGRWPSKLFFLPINVLELGRPVSGYTEYLGSRCSGGGAVAVAESQI